MEIYQNLSKIYPRKLKEKYREIFILASVKSKFENFLGFTMFSSIGLFFFLALFLFRMLGYKVLFFLPLSLVFIHFMFYLLLVLQADARARIVEDILPDALNLMSANLRAGMTTDQALMLAVKPEFGPLADELNLIGKEVVMGGDIGEALVNMSKNIRSRKLSESMHLINSGLISGGELAQLLSYTAQNLRNQKFVEDKIKSSVFMYFIFIFSALAFGAPLLFSLSSFLVEVLAKNLGSMDIPHSAYSSSSLTLSEVSVSPSFIIMFVIILLITTSILGSLILGIIRGGKERDGVKFIPLLVLVTLVIFIALRFVIHSVFSLLFF